MAPGAPDIVARRRPFAPAIPLEHSQNAERYFGAAPRGRVFG
jgi:hypothetical protein